MVTIVVSDTPIVSYRIGVEDVGFRLYILFLKLITESQYCINYLLLLLQGGPAKVKPTYITLFYPSKCTNALLFNSAIL